MKKIYSVYINMDCSGYTYSLFNQQAKQIAHFYLSPGLGGFVEGDNISDFEVEVGIQVYISPHENITDIDNKIHELIKLAWLERNLNDDYDYRNRWKVIVTKYCNIQTLPIGGANINAAFFRNLITNQRDASNEDEAKKAFFLICRYLYNAPHSG